VKNKIDPDELGQMIRFLIAGGIVVVVQLGTLYVCKESFGFATMTAVIISSVFDMLIAFIIQRTWTFKVTGKKNVGKHMGFYFILRAGTYILNVIAMYIIVERLHVQYMIAQIILILVFSIISYVLTKKIFAL